MCMFILYCITIWNRSICFRITVIFDIISYFITKNLQNCRMCSETYVGVGQVWGCFHFRPGVWTKVAGVVGVDFSEKLGFFGIQPKWCFWEFFQKTDFLNLKTLFNWKPRFSRPMIWLWRVTIQDFPTVHKRSWVLLDGRISFKSYFNDEWKIVKMQWWLVWYLF